MFMNLKLFRSFRPYSQQFFDLRQNTYNIFKKLIDERKAYLAKHSNDSSKIQRAYIDYMLEYEQEGKVSMDEIVADASLVFNAGTDTSSSTLEYGLLLLCKFQDIQKKLRNELLSVSSVHDSKKDTYTASNKSGDNYRTYSVKLWNKSILYRAFIYELFRISSIATHGVHHFNRTRKDIPIKVGDKEYVIPNKTMIFYNSEYVHKYSKSEKSWKHNQIDGLSCEDICLDNWLIKDEKNGKQVFSNKDQKFYGFGKGRRDCVGRSFAEKEIYVVLAYIILNFHVTFNPDILKQYNNIATNVRIKVKHGFSNSVDPQVGICLQKLY